jgi:hypothetical protein
MIEEIKEHEVEYLVKWEGRSYLEVEWISNADFKTKTDKLKLRCYHKRQERAQIGKVSAEN